MLIRTYTPARGPKKQDGATLFFALIGLVILLLAGAALVRTVDTTSIIAGNLSFRMSATASGDRGMEAAMVWLNTTMTASGAPVGSQQAINDGLAATTTSIPASGYYSSTGEVADLFADATWANGVSRNLGGDDGGNSVRYIIERMCRNANTLPGTDHCIYTELTFAESKQAGEDPPAYRSDKALIFRITARVEGPRNTVSYIQGFVY